MSRSKFSGAFDEIFRSEGIDTVRTRMLAADGLRNDQIAARLNCRREVVSQWRERVFEQRVAGVEDRPRRGRPPALAPSRGR
jgi:transposase